MANWSTAHGFTVAASRTALAGTNLLLGGVGSPGSSSDRSVRAIARPVRPAGDGLHRAFACRQICDIRSAATTLDGTFSRGSSGGRGSTCGSACSASSSRSSSGRARVPDRLLRRADRRHHHARGRVIQAFPFLILIIAIVAVLGTGLTQRLLAIALVAWVSYAGLVRGEDPGGQAPEYVEAARASGLPRRAVIGRHILPNVISSALVYAMADVIIYIVRRRRA